MTPEMTVPVRSWNGHPFRERTAESQVDRSWRSPSLPGERRNSRTAQGRSLQNKDAPAGPHSLTS